VLLLISATNLRERTHVENVNFSLPAPQRTPICSEIDEESDMASNLMASPAATLYEEDFVLWTQGMARLIENRQTEGLDWDNLAEEIRDLGNSLKSAMSSHLENLLNHLIKWELQPQRRTRSWEDTISNSRREIDFLADRTPSLKRHLLESFDNAYTRACRYALRETRLPPQLPSACGPPSRFSTQAFCQSSIIVRRGVFRPV